MSKQRKEEEQKILAQMEEAMQEEKQTPKTEKKTSFYGVSQPESIHCRRCGTLLEKGVCPTCGFTMYVPMDEAKRKKIKTIGTVIGFAVFIVLFVVLQWTKN